MKIPQNLRETLEAQGELACFAMVVNDAASIIIKATDSDIDLWRGDRPVGLQPMLGKYPTGAVIGLLVTVYELGGTRFTADTVLNVESEYDLALLQQLGRQKEWYLHLFNQDVEYQFSKAMPLRSKKRRELRSLVRQAQRHNKKCRQFNYALARRQFFADTADRFR